MKRRRVTVRRHPRRRPKRRGRTIVRRHPRNILSKPKKQYYRVSTRGFTGDYLAVSYAEARKRAMAELSGFGLIKTKRILRVKTKAKSMPKKQHEKVARLIRKELKKTERHIEKRYNIPKRKVVVTTKPRKQTEKDKEFRKWCDDYVHEQARRRMMDSKKLLDHGRRCFGYKADVNIEDTTNTEKQRELINMKNDKFRALLGKAIDWHTLHMYASELMMSAPKFDLSIHDGVTNTITLHHINANPFLKALNRKIRRIGLEPEHIKIKINPTARKRFEKRLILDDRIGEVIRKTDKPLMSYGEKSNLTELRRLKREYGLNATEKKQLEELLRMS